MDFYLLVFCIILSIIFVLKDILIEFKIMRGMSLDEARQKYSYKGLCKYKTHAITMENDAWVIAMQEKINSEQRPQNQSSFQKDILDDEKI